MAKKEISVLIKARNAMAAGLASAGAALKKFGQSAARIGAFFAKAFLAAGTAIVALGIKAVSAYSIQEKSEKEAEAALRAYGDEITNNMSKIKAFAAAIQNETGIGDENVISMAARLKMLGVEADQLEAATKATIALGKAGMQEEAAIKAIALAQAGEYTMLQRYLPALRTATTEAEKAKAVNDFLTKSYAATKDELDTVSGRWREFKGRIGDAWEEIGKLIAENTELNGLLQRASGAVKKFGESVAQWAAGGGVGRMIDAFKNFGNEAKATFENIVAYSKYGVDNMLDNVQWFGNATATIFRNMKNVVENVWGTMADSIGYQIARLQAKVTGQEWNIKPPQARDLMAGVEAIPEKSEAAGKELDRKLEEIEKERLARQTRIAGGGGASGTDGVVEAAKTEQEEILIARENFDKEYMALDKKRAELAKQQFKAETDAAQKAMEEKISALEKEQAKREEVAGKNIADIIAEQKADKDAADAWAKDVRKAEELEKRMKRGTKLGREQREWLAAFNQIQQAKNLLQPGQRAINAAQQQLAAMNNQDKLGDILGELGKVHKDLNDLLQRA